ncbi:trigger factor [Candidatus Tisiphia endosymbiont of Beris chalybata]|uniref:trigger factor n=1 Tax=Candidatus Tisiphia endosymbiont of Beris chalybata TaxID=3066262 RepID=UPI00312CB393
MQVTELKNDSLNFEAKIVIPWAKIIDEVQKELTILSQKVKIDGFRAGKVPTKLIEKKYKLSVKFDVMGREISQAIKDVVKNYTLNIIGDPILDPSLEELYNKEEQDLEFTLKYELLPNIILPEFKQIIINRPKLIIQQEEINAALDNLASTVKAYTNENMDSAEKGHQVTIDAIGYIDGEAFAGGKVTDYKLVLGSKTFTDNFEDQLIGAKAGEEVEVNITFPEDYHLKEIAGKAAKFIVQIKAVHSAQEVIIDDEFAQKFDCDTLETLCNKISKKIEEELEEPILTIMKMSLFDQLEKILTFQVPPSLITQEINILKAQTEKNSGSNGVFQNKTEEEIDDYYHKLALRRVRVGLILAEYMKIKALQLTHEDINKAIIAQLRHFPGQEQKIVDFYQKNPKALGNLTGPLLEEKTVQHIFEHEVTLNEKEYTRTELEEFLTQQEDRII